MKKILIALLLLSASANAVPSLQPQAMVQLLNKARTIAERQALSKQYRQDYIVPAVAASLNSNYNFAKFASEADAKKVFGIKRWSASTPVNQANLVAALKNYFTINPAATVADLVEAIALGNLGREIAIDYSGL